MTTTSVSGAAGGGVAVVPSVAVSLSTVTTDASLGTGATTTLGGTLVVTRDADRVGDELVRPARRRRRRRRSVRRSL